MGFSKITDTQRTGFEEAIHFKPYPHSLTCENLQADQTGSACYPTRTTGKPEFAVSLISWVSIWEGSSIIKPKPNIKLPGGISWHHVYKLYFGPPWSTARTSWNAEVERNNPPSILKKALELLDLRWLVVALLKTGSLALASLTVGRRVRS